LTTLDETLAAIQDLQPVATKVRMHSRDVERLKLVMPVSTSAGLFGDLAELEVHADDDVPEGDPRLDYSDGSSRRLRP
jgi:hypothetical protein